MEVNTIRLQSCSFWCGPVALTSHWFFAVCARGDGSPDGLMPMVPGNALILPSEK